MTATDERKRRGSTASWWWFALSAAGIAVYAPLPYLGSSLRELAGQDVGLAGNYADAPALVGAVLYVHIVFAGLALLLAPIQFVGRIRERVPRLHRVSGRVVMTAMLVGGGAGIVLAPFNAAGPVGTVGSACSECFRSGSWWRRCARSDAARWPPTAAGPYVRSR